MKRPQTLYSFALLSLLSGVLVPCFAKNGRNSRQAKDYTYQNEYDYNQGDSDYYKPKPVDPRIPCYTCTYHHFGENRTQGLVNCNEPFNSRDIPEVMCNGSCALTRYQMEKPTNFLMIRECLPNCKEVETDTMYTKCCSTRLCNGFTSAVPLFTIDVYLVVFLTGVALLKRITFV